MASYLPLLVVVLAVLSSTKCATVNTGGVLQARINMDLKELQSNCQDAVLCWNWITLQTMANDFDTTIAARPDQDGPTKAARALAIIHAAIYEGMSAFDPNFKPVLRPKTLPKAQTVNKNIATNAAIGEGAYQTLYSLFPQQRPIFDALRTQFFKQLDNNNRNKASVTAGILVGRTVGQYILNIRSNDGSQRPMPYTPTLQPGFHRVDPTNPGQGFLDSLWGSVTPFFLTSGAQFRPTAGVGNTVARRAAYLNSSRYIRDFNEVKTMGIRNSTTRTADQTEIGIFWAYDGAPRIGVPPRLYNQVVRVIAIKKKNTLQENAKLFALLNFGLADASISSWETKYFYSFWRPIVGIRQATGFTVRDPRWIPLGSPPDSARMVFTPNFPAFVSGHSTFGSTTFETLRLFYKSDNFQFAFQSDEYNGKTFDTNTGQIRPKRTRRYNSFSQAEDENFLGRIFLGVHWRYDQEEGKNMGRHIAQFIAGKFV